MTVTSELALATLRWMARKHPGASSGEWAARELLRNVNARLTLAYWQVGERIRREVLGDKRATYGAEILPTLSAKLVSECREGFRARNLARMVGFAAAFPDFKMVKVLAAQLGWSHFVEILALKDPLAREFHAELSQARRIGLPVHESPGRLLANLPTMGSRLRHLCPVAGGSLRP